MSNTALTASQQAVSKQAASKQAARSRRDAERNYRRVLEAAREVFGEAGADASMEEIAVRAGVGVGTVYRRFASKDALIDELLRLSMDTLMAAADEALHAPGGEGLERYLQATGQEFAAHAKYADLLLTRTADPAARERLLAAVAELTRRAVAAGAVAPDVTTADITALIWSLRGLVQAPDVTPDAWQRYITIHLAGLRNPTPPQKNHA